jgi:hypothetical protein
MESSYVLLTFITEIVQDTTTESVKQMTEWNVMVGAQTKVWMAQRLEALNDLVIKMMALGSEHSLALSGTTKEPVKLTGAMANQDCRIDLRIVGMVCLACMLLARGGSGSQLGSKLAWAPWTWTWI